MLTALGLVTALASAQTPDPNFYIYLCFGQSNMEGNAKAESVDKQNVDKRFQMLATTDFDSPKRTMGNWYTATPPIVSPIGGLGMADYFGRTMVAAMPAEVRIGVVDVAIGGCDIRMFDKDKYKTYAQKDDWSGQLARQYYGGNPYKRLIDMAKIAQQSGVIKGILLHQGCTNCNDSNWPSMVKKIYNDILNDLGLATDTIPLFVGETLREENGGGCASHNNQVARMPNVIANSYVISSEGCSGNGQDPWHFNAMGYRIMGKRYAFSALQVMGRETIADPDYQFPASLKKFYAAQSIITPEVVVAMPGERIPVSAKFQDGHTENISDVARFASDDVTFTDDGSLSPVHEGKGSAEAIYTDFTRSETRGQLQVQVSFFPFDKAHITRLAGSLTYDEAAHSFKMGAGGQSGWVFAAGADFSAYKYLIVKLKEPQELDAEVRIYSKNNVGSPHHRDTIGTRTTVCIDLNNLKCYNKEEYVDPSKVFIVGLRTKTAGTLFIDEVFLSNDDDYAQTGITDLQLTPFSLLNPVYSLKGIKVGTLADWNRLPNGIYVVNGKLKTR